MNKGTLSEIKNYILSSNKFKLIIGVTIFIILLVIVFSSNIFGYSKKEYQDNALTANILASQFTNDKDFDSYAKRTFFSPSESDINLGAVEAQKTGDFYVSATNKSKEYVLVKVTATAQTYQGIKSGVGYGVVSPESTGNIIGEINLNDNNELTMMPNVKVEKVAIMDMDKAIDRFKKNSKM